MAALLLDENVPRSVALHLAAAGHDTALAAECMAGADDLAVLAMARAQDRVLVTFDADFGDLVFRHGHAAPPGIIFLRLHPVDSLTAASLIELALQAAPGGQLVVASVNNLRWRPLPRSTKA